MQTITFTRPNRPWKLYDELVAAIPAVGDEPFMENPLLTISSNGQTGSITFPDDVTEAQIMAVVDAHDAATPGVGELAADAAVANERTLDERLAQQLPILRDAISAITASPPTLFAGLSNQERVFLRRMARNQSDLIRLVLRLLEATD